MKSSNLGCINEDEVTKTLLIKYREMQLATAVSIYVELRGLKTLKIFEYVDIFTRQFLGRWPREYPRAPVQIGSMHGSDSIHPRFITVDL